MADQSGENPFRGAVPAKRDDGATRFKPFSKEDRLGSPTKQDQLRTIAQLNLVDPSVLEKTPKIRDLTVRDLNDLAAEFTGIDTNNPRVADLTLQDIQDIEGVFFEFKLAQARDLGARGLEELALEVDVSCCCCCPCCCCAAADMSHTHTA